VLAGCVLAVGCGSGVAAASGKGSGKANGSDVATARHLNVTAAAIPGSWKKEPQGTAKDVVRSSFDSCLSTKGKPRPPVAAATSSTFLNASDGREVSSQVQVFKSAGAASAAATKAGGAAFGHCLSKTVRADLPATLTGQTKLQRIRVTAGGVPAMKSGEFSQRIETVIVYKLPSGKTAGTTAFIDLVGFAHQTAFVAVEFESLGSAPPKSLESATLASLRSRAAGAG